MYASAKGLASESGRRLARLNSMRSTKRQSPVRPRAVFKAAQTITGSLAWLIERYRETGEWTRLSLATRRLRENIFGHVIESAGIQPCRQDHQRRDHGGARSSHTDPG